MPGYVGEHAAANEAFHDGWFRTGDLGYVDATGNLYVTGRTKLYISTSGFKVDPFEVEAVLRAHPAVADVVVVGVKGDLGEEVVKAVVVPDPAAAIDPQRLPEEAAGGLSGRPRSVQGAPDHRATRRDPAQPARQDPP